MRCSTVWRLLLAVLVGCAHPKIAVRGNEVLRHLDELGREGSARIDTVRTDGDDVTPADTETVFLYQTVSVGDSTAPLAKLVDGCGALAGVRPCPIGPRSLIVLRDVEAAAHATRVYGQPNVQPAQPAGQTAAAADKAVAATFFLGGVGSAGLCALLCEDHKLGYSLGLLSGGLLSAVVWGILSGYHD